MNTRLISLLALLPLAAPAVAFAHGDMDHGGRKAVRAEMKETAFGRTGDPGKATRTIEIDMSDKMRFTPSELTIRRGETVRFVVKNSGRLTHELVLGSMQELKEHAEMMKKHPGMEHEEPYMVHVAPGKSGRITWQFTREGEFHFGCLEPGHFEAGMVGRINVIGTGGKK